MKWYLFHASGVRTFRWSKCETKCKLWFMLWNCSGVTLLMLIVSGCHASVSIGQVFIWASVTMPSVGCLVDCMGSPAQRLTLDSPPSRIIVGIFWKGSISIGISDIPTVQRSTHPPHCKIIINLAYSHAMSHFYSRGLGVDMSKFDHCLSFYTWRTFLVLMDFLSALVRILSHNM